jgi:hypothetical protein
MQISVNTCKHPPRQVEGAQKPTFRNLLALVNLCGLGLQQLISLLAQAQKGSTRDGSLGDLGKNARRNSSGIVVLGEGIGVGDGVV